MPTFSRRTLVRYASWFTSACFAAAASRVRAASLNPDTLQKFVDPLPIPAVARSLETRPIPSQPSVRVPFYRVTMQQIQAKLHRDLPPARLWTYGNSFPAPTLDVRSGQGILIEWANELPVRHFLPIDHTLHGAEPDKPEVRAVVHVHGAKVPPGSDGYPESWYVPGRSATYFYPNRQDACTLWYHDHAMGINRLNIYAGMFGMFLVRDDFEDSLQLPAGKYEIPLLICDRQLSRDGQLEYPVSPDPKAPWVPEVFGEAFMVNGKLFPFLEVEPRPYRFRMVNVSNGRFLHLFVSGPGSRVVGFQQIGTEQGLLPAVVPVERVQLAPGERIDLVIDFSEHAGDRLVLNNDAFEVMQFRVAKTKNGASPVLPATLRPLKRIAEDAAVKTRELGLIEIKTGVGESMTMLLNNAHWDMPVTEKPVLDSVEIWSLINTTDDTHPIHLHLVRFQILDRRRFDAFDYQTKGVIRYTGPTVPPAPFESGWKDTVRADSKMVTRIIVRFEGFAGRYVWHCHILEHEDNEMMRPYDVQPG